MAHPNEETLRAAYAAFARGDSEGHLKLCTDDITFRVPGRGPVAGVHMEALVDYDLNLPDKLPGTTEHEAIKSQYTQRRKTRR